MLTTRRFQFIFDPSLLETIALTTSRFLIDLLVEFRRNDPPVIVDMLAPVHLGDAVAAHIVEKEEPLQSVTPAAQQFVPSNHLKEEVTERLAVRDDPTRHGLELLALAQEHRSDGIITDNQPLVATRYQILQHHRIRIIPFSEAGDVVEVCGRGHGILRSVANPYTELPFEVFYPWSHWKNHRLERWVSGYLSKRRNRELRDNLHSAVRHRYPFIAYSRDLVRFYELQVDHFVRHGGREPRLLLGYHTTNFYLYLWGMLDHLTIVAKHALGLRLDNRECGIRSREFWRAIKRRRPALHHFIKYKAMAEWIDVMSDVRHAAAHRTMLLPGAVLADTDESKKSDKEVLKILRKEQGLVFRALPLAARRALEREQMWVWRIKARRTVLDNAVYIRRHDRGYLRPQVVSVDHDFSMLNAVIDAFLVGLFRRPLG